MPLRMRVHDREPIGAALRRFKKLLERSGVTKELRRRKYYEKPCEAHSALTCANKTPSARATSKSATDRPAKGWRPTAGRV